MIILDNSIINHLLDKGISIPSHWRIFLPEDLFEEVSYAFELRGSAIPKHFLNLNETEAFNLVEYYKNYYLMLNKYGGRSFFNLTGFGDVSLLAASKTFLEQSEKQAQIPGMEEAHEIYTEDVGLSSRLKKEFSTKTNLKICSLLDLEKNLKND